MRSVDYPILVFLLPSWCLPLLFAKASYDYLFRKLRKAISKHHWFCNSKMILKGYPIRDKDK